MIPYLANNRKQLGSLLDREGAIGGRKIWWLRQVKILW